jgi:hypothetical protein
MAVKGLVACHDAAVQRQFVDTTSLIVWPVLTSLLLGPASSGGRYVAHILPGMSLASSMFCKPNCLPINPKAIVCNGRLPHFGQVTQSVLLDDGTAPIIYSVETGPEF